MTAPYTLGVAYYPDYLFENTLARKADGSIQSLTIEARIEEDMRRMVKAGLSVIRIGEFSWAHVEPAPGQYHPERFLKTLDLASKYGLKVIVCTPTATPPKWLTDLHPEVLPITRSQKTMLFGGRRHYDVTSTEFRKYSRKITTFFAETFGTHPSIIGWQTDNELGNHTSSRSFTPSARSHFQSWLKNKYGGDIALLNETWFTCFWSHHYRSFEEIDLPYDNWTDPNPHLELDFRRFMSYSYKTFQKEQIDIIRKHSPGRWITHNITPMFFDLCLWELTEDLDFAGYDHYQCESLPNPLSSASQFNFMRSLKNSKKFFILEQQPVQVNWQPVNDRHGFDWLFLWGVQSAVLGSDAMLYFSWQKFPGGSEQYHDGIVPHDLRVPESRQEKTIRSKLKFFAELKKTFQLSEIPLPSKDIVLINNLESHWSHDICFQTNLWNPIKVVEEAQLPFIANGFGVDMAKSIRDLGHDLHNYKVLLIPGYAFEFQEQELKLLEEFIKKGGKVISWPRTAMKQSSSQMSQFPLALFDRNDFYLDDYGALRADEFEQISFKNKTLTGKVWAEKIVITAHNRWKTLATFQAGHYAGSPAIIEHSIGKGSYIHLAFLPEVNDDFTKVLLELLHLKPHVSTATGGATQLIRLSSGKKTICCALNFAQNPAAINLESKITTTILRARLTFDLDLDSKVEHVSHCSSVLLNPREVAFWEEKHA